MPIWGSLYFQNASSPIMEQMIFFHDHIMVILILVTFMVGYFLFSLGLGISFNRVMFGGQGLEVVWTGLPVLFLLVIAFPSLKLLYMMEGDDSSDLTISVTGSQWFWSYEYADFEVMMVDSFMLPEEGDVMFRLLEVNNGFVIPKGSGVRMIISSSDVIHSWTIPSLGVKSDGVPGRLNQVMVQVSRPGYYVGQCSEICGSNHSFMPIVLTVVSKLDFLKFMV